MKKILIVLSVLLSIFPVYAAGKLKFKSYSCETKKVLNGKIEAGNCAFFTVNNVGITDADLIQLADDLKDSGFYHAVIYFTEDGTAYIIRNNKGNIDLGYGLQDRKTNTFTKRYKTGSISRKSMTISWWEL